jgi:hypothetical protein
MDKTVEELTNIAKIAFKEAIKQIQKEVKTKGDALNVFGHMALMSLDICFKKCCADEEEKADFLGHFLNCLAESNPGIIIRDMSDELH